mgnify:CR=1 FL=1
MPRFNIFASIAEYKYLLLMQLLSVGSFYLGYESDKYCDFSVHLGNFLLEYQCPHAKPQSNGSIPQDDGSSDGEATQSSGTFPSV